MIEQVLRYLNNYFIYDKASATSVLPDGILSSDPEVYMAGQYVYVSGSVLNDGVYKITAIEGNKLVIDGTMNPESGRSFHVYGLAIPKSVLDIAKEIEAYNEANPNGIKSESLGDYSVSYGGSSSVSGSSDWVTVFYAKLAPFRKVYLNLPR